MRRFASIAVVLPLLMPLAGCGDTSSTKTADAGTTYVDGVQALFDPTAKMAQLVTAPLRRPPGPWPTRAQVDQVLEDAVSAHAALREMPLHDVGLRAQRDRLTNTYSTVLGRMRDVGRDLGARDQVALRADSKAFFAALRDLAATP